MSEKCWSRSTECTPGSQSAGISSLPEAPCCGCGGFVKAEYWGPALCEFVVMPLCCFKCFCSEGIKCAGTLLMLVSAQVLPSLPAWQAGQHIRAQRQHNFAFFSPCNGGAEPCCILCSGRFLSRCKIWPASGLHSPQIRRGTACKSAAMQMLHP